MTKDQNLARTCNRMFEVISKDAQKLGVDVDEYFDDVFRYFTEEF